MSVAQLGTKGRRALSNGMQLDRARRALSNGMQLARGRRALSTDMQLDHLGTN